MTKSKEPITKYKKRRNTINEKKRKKNKKKTKKTLLTGRLQSPSSQERNLEKEEVQLAKRNEKETKKTKKTSLPVVYKVQAAKNEI